MASIPPDLQPNQGDYVRTIEALLDLLGNEHEEAPCHYGTVPMTECVRCSCIIAAKRLLEVVSGE